MTSIERTMLPESTLSFTIPSIHDGTTLDCRVYHPVSLTATNPKAPPWRKHAAVVAHPYAPMGGCYDDPTLESVAARLLRAGYLVGTFNFRGAGHSAGRTSWTAKPERDDYASVVGFMAHYIHFLDPFGPHAAALAERQQAAAAAAAARRDNDADTVTKTTTTVLTDNRTPQNSSIPTSNESPVFLMGGYSYGAMVTTQLPPIEDILTLFISPDADSNAAQIRVRAQNLAEQQNLILGSMRAATKQIRNPHSPTKRPTGVRIGGDEGDRSPRKSHDSFGRRSFSLDAEDKLRRGVHEFVAKRKAKHHGHHHLHWPQGRPVSGPESDGVSRRSRSLERSEPESPEKHVKTAIKPEPEKLPVITDFQRPRPAYILVSPLQGLVTHLVTMSLFPSRHMKHDDAAEEKLTTCPTLAVFGDDDVFVPAGKLRAWTTKLSGLEGSRFMGYEVAGAGHFWAEEGVLHAMTGRVDTFAGDLIKSMEG